jgi:hypothetical protein
MGLVFASKSAVSQKLSKCFWFALEKPTSQKELQKRLQAEQSVRTPREVGAPLRAQFFFPLLG